MQLAETPALPPPVGLTAFPMAEAKTYPINLPAALKLGNVRGLDIEVAARRLQVAVAQNQGPWPVADQPHHGRGLQSPRRSHPEH